MRRAAFTVAPSLLPESFGIVALEAAAAGKPTIASALGGLADVVVDGETGFLVPPGDVEGLRGALERLAGDPALRERMGEAARARAAEFEERFCYDRYCDARLGTRAAGTRFMSTGHTLVGIGEAKDRFFMNADGGFLALSVRPSKMRPCEAELMRRFKLEKISFDELLFDALRAEAEELEIDWPTIEGADGTDRSCRHGGRAHER